MKFSAFAWFFALAMHSCTTNPTSSSLLGADFDEVRARFGVPLACSAGGGVLQFAYPGEHGVLEDAVVVADGVVVRIAPDIRCAPAIAGAQALVGAHIEAAVAQLGAVRRVVVGASSSEVEFDGATVTVCDDCVVRVRETAALLTAGR